VLLVGRMGAVFAVAEKEQSRSAPRHNTGRCFRHPNRLINKMPTDSRQSKGYPDREVSLSEVVDC
jgi:hypothetical protein